MSATPKAEEFGNGVGGGAASRVATSTRRPVLVRVVARLERDSRLDGPAGRLRAVAARLVGEGPRRELLRGRHVGHALHPFLTDLPLGAWSSALVLDIAGGTGSRPAARRLVGLGILTAFPAVATGLAETGALGPRASRVATVHAVGNAAGVALFTSSYLARRRGRDTRGVVLSVLGGAAMTLSGFLGGHLAIARKAGGRDYAFAGADTPLAPPPRNRAVTGDARAEDGLSTSS
jgi:uncharacterized membrane protein